ncbi:hypothetical protein QCA50_011228 [Cerrena zonata]|uniref:DUF6535 domain-containing protein n=1 Tax=Cerrena zonata TaxID=2478898 RepID=A0AAW0FY67_9APHY
MSSSSSSRRRISRASNRSSTSDSDGASNSQKHSNEVPVVEQSEDKYEHSQPNIDSEYLAQDVDNLSFLGSMPPSDSHTEAIEGNAVTVGAQGAIPMPVSHWQSQTVGRSPPDDKDGFPNTEDKVHRVKIESDRTGWGRLSDLIGQYDRHRVEDVKEDIDTLLVFAGLFSAVITAFIIESYKTLQQQPEDTTNKILLQLSAQLASLTLSGNFVNSTVPLFTSPPFVPARFSVVINTMWLLSLVVALITASLGILVKQWLHELMAHDTQDPRQQVKLRFFREVGVQRWQVFEIAAALPLLLQFALLLFFIGLSAFLHDLNPVVTWVVTGVMILWLFFYLFATFTPVFSSQCPYKTPMLKGFLHQVRVGSLARLSSLGSVLYNHIPATWPTIKQRCKDLRDSLNTWSTVWMAHEETEVCDNGTWDLSTIICSQELLRGEQLDEAIADCFRYCDVRSLLHCFKHLSQGVGPDAQGVLPSIPRGLIVPEFDLFRSLMGTLVTPSDSIVALSRWYITSTYALVKSYDPLGSRPIPRTSLPILTRLLNENETSAVFSVLTMFSVRYYSLENHPGDFDYLFPLVSDVERQRISIGIGEQSISNLVGATRAICHSLRNQSQTGSDVDISGILWRINRTRSDSDLAIPIDPIALISTFAYVLYTLALPAVRQEHQEILVGVMGDLANIVTDTDGSSWSYSRKQCVIYTHSYFHEMDLVDEHLVSKLGNLICTWRPEFGPNIPSWDH